MTEVDKALEKVSEVSADLGRSIIAGFVGTLTMTLSQMIEMKISKRSESFTPVETAGDVLGFQARDENERKKLNNWVHFAYGTVWGVAKGILSDLGIKGKWSTLLEFISVWGTELILLPALKKSPPVTKWSTNEIVKDAFNHAMYAAVSGMFFDILKKHSCRVA